MIRFLPLLLFTRLLMAQSITGSIVGTVRDPGALAVTGADVTLIQTATGAGRQARTGERGDFVFGAVQPGEYTIAITHEGFKKTERTGIVLSASEILSTGVIVLSLGSISDSVTVTATGAVVQTASAERAGSVTGNQVDNLLIRGRNVMSLVGLLPGVVDLLDNDAINRSWNLNVNGSRRNTTSVSLDGMTLNNSGNQFNSAISVSQDSVAEVKILLSNYQAEYGRMSGANIQLVSKSGTRDFHGLGSYFKRHEQFNANDYFNNQRGIPKPRYRYNTWSYNVGGPAYIPGKFNRNREKLFFFWSQEFWPSASTSGGQVTVPTELERAGDFSRSVDLGGKPVATMDPTTRQPFAGNRIPLSRLDPNGQALLNVFPKPNFFDRTISAGAYNYVFQSRAELPQRMDTLKLDYHLNPANVLSVNVSTHSDITRGWRPNGGNWPQVNNTYDYLARVYTARYQRIFSPAVINEFNVGYSRAEGVDTNIDEAVRQNQRDTAGFKLGQFNPSSNPMRLLPDATFGGVSGAAQLSIAGQFPLGGPNQVLTFTDNLSIARGPHMFKVGIYVDRVTRNVSTDGTFHGSFDFGNNANNPLNSGYAYANAALGVFNSYSETSRRFFPRYLLRNSEWFAQDNWRINRRLTLDYGMRFAIVSPASEMDDLLSGFVAAQYSPAGRVQLVRPIMADGRKSGINPVTGEVLPATVIGDIAPGAGVAANGMISPSTDAGYPRGLTNGRGVQFGPRLGFAFDPEGKGAMAIRGGFGMFYNRQSVASTVQRYTGQPPLVNTPVIYFGTMPTLLSSAGWLFPQNVNGVDRSGEIPCVMNYSLSVQRKIGRGTVVDVAYVGSLGRHLMWARDINSIPFGTNFDPRNADPTNTKTPLPAAFLRPIPGYGQISIADSGASSNYHSLQVSANRRFSHSLEFGAAWTWSKAMDFNDNDTDLISTQVPVRVWNYGMAAFDRTHTLRANWLWEVPAPGWRSLPARAMLRNWQVSGIASFISGAPQNVTFSTTTAMDITGSSTDGARIVVTGNPVLPKGERSFERFFRTDVFQLPARGSIGNSARTLFRGPGINSWDLAVFRNFPVREKMRLQFRWELYNAFNHTQFNNLDRNARFDPQGNQINARFGQLTAARPARIMQFAARFYF